MRFDDVVQSVPLPREPRGNPESKVGSLIAATTDTGDREITAADILYIGI